MRTMLYWSCMPKEILSLQIQSSWLWLSSGLTGWWFLIFVQLFPQDSIMYQWFTPLCFSVYVSSICVSYLIDVFSLRSFIIFVLFLWLKRIHTVESIFWLLHVPMKPIKNAEENLLNIWYLFVYWLLAQSSGCHFL